MRAFLTILLFACVLAACDSETADVALQDSSVEQSLADDEQSEEFDSLSEDAAGGKKCGKGRKTKTCSSDQVCVNGMCLFF
jgi:hypothetical protein